MTVYQHPGVEGEESVDGDGDEEGEEESVDDDVLSYVGCFADAAGDGRLMPTLAAADPSGMTAEVRRLARVM